MKIWADKWEADKNRWIDKVPWKEQWGWMQLLRKGGPVDVRKTSLYLRGKRLEFNIQE